MPGRWQLRLAQRPGRAADPAGLHALEDGGDAVADQRHVTLVRVAAGRQVEAEHQLATLVGTEQGVGDSELTLGDSLEQDIEPSALETMDQASFLDQVRLSLDMLSEKERRIITLHFGLNGAEAMTLECIGKSFDPPISRERVRQIEERAFQKIRERRRVLLGSFLGGAVR